MVYVGETGTSYQVVALPIGDSSCSDGQTGMMDGETDGSGNADIPAGWESWSDDVNWSLGNPGYITSDDILQMGIETEDSVGACLATFWYDLNDDAPVPGSVGGPGIDLVLNGYRINSNAQVTVEARPIGQSPPTHPTLSLATDPRPTTAL